MSGGLCIAVVLAAVGVAVYGRLRLLRLFWTFDQMLDEAIEGRFSASRYDESCLSEVENKLARYLDQCGLSSMRLAGERERLQKLIADVSHQTKTPLASIMLYAGLLKEQPLPDVCRRSVEALSEQVERLQFLIDALVESGRLELGVISVQPRPEPLAPCIAASVEQALPAAHAKDISVSWDETGAAAVFDPKWTQEALFNLLDNAVKYTPSRGSIRISVQEYEMFCRVDVADTGMGIEEEELGRIFERFYRSPAARDAQGVGLGLFLAREIVSAQGGYIKAASVPGEGSVFSIFLQRRM